MSRGVYCSLGVSPVETRCRLTSLAGIDKLVLTSSVRGICSNLVLKLSLTRDEEVLALKSGVIGGHIVLATDQIIGAVVSSRSPEGRLTFDSN